MAGDELTFYLTNHQGSTVAMAKEDGTFVPAYYKYDPYGNELSDAPLAGQPYRYTGRRLDPQTGLCAPAGAFSLYI